jgi:hypothetical protein
MTKKDFIYLFIIFVIVTLFMNKCSDDTLPKSDLKVYNVKDTSVVTRIDTTHFSDTTKIIVKIPIYTPVYDTLGKSYIYDNPINDSLISGNIKTTLIDCKMISQQLTYIPKFPKYIYRTDSVTIHDSTYVERTIYQEPKTKIGIGFTGLVSSQPTIFANILVKTKKDDIFAIGYDPFYKSILISYNRLLTFKRNK